MFMYMWIAGLSGESKGPMENVGAKKFSIEWNGSFEHDHIAMMTGGDPSNLSVPTLGVLVSEQSDANNQKSASNFCQNKHVGHKISMPFYDFLGVGNT